MKLNNRQILEMANAIKSLNGYKLAVLTRLHLAQILVALAPAIDAYTQARESLLMTHSAGKGNIEVSDPGYAPFNVGVNALMIAEVTITRPASFTFTMVELNAEENPISIEVFAALIPLTLD